MGLVDRLINRPRSETTASHRVGQADSLLDGSLDTLDAILRATGEYSFELEDQDPRFLDLCREYARHVTNGAAIVDEGVEADDGGRDWARVRRFYIERRQSECEFVSGRAEGYRRLVDEMVAGLKAISAGEEKTANEVTGSLTQVEQVAIQGDPTAVRTALAAAMNTIAGAFAAQRQHFDEQLKQANRRMLSLRSDLAATRENLKRDPLTDMFNRGAFDTALQQTVSLNFILRQPVSVIMLDIDQFKAVNDAYGHAAGDEILRSVSDCLARTFVRRSDVVARFGGDEFAIILPDVTVATAATLLQRLLDMVRATVRIPYADPSNQLTLSAGATELLPTDTVESVLSRADRALYSAKSAGRDQLVVDATGRENTQES